MSCTTCAILRRERDEALERVRQLELSTAPRDGLPARLSARLRLTRSEALVMAVLMQREMATKQYLFDVLYYDDPNGGPDRDIFAVFICRMRKKLRCFGVEIVNRHGVGWSLLPDMKAKLRELIATSAATAPEAPCEEIGGAS